MCEEDFYKDNGVAYNSENFDDESFISDMECECPCWDECMYTEEQVQHYCRVWKECREGTL